MRKLLAVIVVGALALGVAGSADGALAVDSFEDLVVSKTGAQGLHMEIDYPPETHPIVHNLMIRDPGTGVDSIVLGKWEMGFLNLVPGGVEVVGYATQPILGDPIRNGFMDGKYYSGVGSGNRPDDVWVIHDGLGDGLGVLSGGTWFLGDDDEVFFSDDILFGPGEVRGDVGQLPIYTASSPDDAILPDMIISPVVANPVPEPSAIGLLGVGLLAFRRRRR